MENNSSEKIVTRNFSPQYFGILDIDPQKIKEAPRFTEPATLEAMVNLGVISSDLVPAKINEVEGEDPALFEEIRDELERRRLATIEKIIAERNAVINRMHGGNFSVSESTKEMRERKRRERKLKEKKREKSKEELLAEKEKKTMQQPDDNDKNAIADDSNYNEAEKSLEKRLLEITAKYNKPLVSDASLPLSSPGSLSSNQESNDDEQQQNEQEEENDNNNDDKAIENVDSLIINNLNKSMNNKNVDQKENIENEQQQPKQTKGKKKGKRKKKAKTKDGKEPPKKPSKIPMPNYRKKKKRVTQTSYDDVQIDTVRRQDRISLMEFRKRKAHETKEKAEELKRRNALRALARVDAIEQRQNQMRQRQQELIKEKARQRMKKLARLEQQNEETWNRRRAVEQSEMLRQERIYQKIKDKGRKKFEEQQRWRMKNIYGQTPLKKYSSIESKENKQSENNIVMLRKKLISSKLSLASQDSQDTQPTLQNMAPQSILQQPIKQLPPQRLVRRTKVSIYKPKGIAKYTSKEKGLSYHSKELLRLPPSNNKPLVPDKGSKIPYFRPR